MENKMNTNLREKVLSELKVVRELLNNKTKSGEDMYCYVIRDYVRILDKKTGEVKEREIRVDFAAKDLGGYDMLDIIFMVDDEAHLSMTDETMVDEVTKKESTYTVYEIWNEDADGTVYTYKVKPMRESDKAKLNAIIQKRIKAYEAAENTKTAQKTSSKS